ncbi:MAG: hypothetical protein JWO80_4642 [Bryobacterales bacterium]|nr:hypothetical protein [Bryobacterales bacterium]
MRAILLSILLAIAVALCAPVLSAYGQEPVPPPADFFSGTVVSATPTEVKVNRKSLTRDSVTKTFVIDEDTKVEGKLKPKVHVTVRFVTEDSVSRAIHIIVHPQ